MLTAVERHFNWSSMLFVTGSIWTKLLMVLALRDGLAWDNGLHGVLLE